MYENRQHERQSTALSGAIRADGSDAAPKNCEIVDLSPGGARIKIYTCLEKGAVVFLQIEEMGEYEVGIAWFRRPMAGLNFNVAPEIMTEVVMAIAMYR